MRNFLKAFGGGIVGALTFLTLSALMGPSGGYPTRPTFQQTVIKGICASTLSTSLLQICNPSGPSLSLTTTGAGTDQKLWDWFTDTSGVMHYRMINDAAAAANDWLNISRTGIVPTAMTLAAPTITTGSTTASASSVLVTAKTAGDTAVGANASAFAAACAEVNATAGAGSCGMPAGKAGLTVFGADMFLHAPTGNIASDANGVTPWAHTWGTLLESSSTCQVSGNFLNITGCTRLGVGVISVTFAAGSFLTTGCAFGDQDATTQHVFRQNSATTLAIQVAAENMSGVPADGFAVYISCS